MLNCKSACILTYGYLHMIHIYVPICTYMQSYVIRGR